jgi:hypothetical protein
MVAVQGVSASDGYCAACRLPVLTLITPVNLRGTQRMRIHPVHIRLQIGNTMTRDTTLVEITSKPLLV